MVGFIVNTTNSWHQICWEFFLTFVERGLFGLLVKDGEFFPTSECEKKKTIALKDIY